MLVHHPPPLHQPCHPHVCAHPRRLQSLSAAHRDVIVAPCTAPGNRAAATDAPICKDQRGESRCARACPWLCNTCVRASACVLWPCWVTCPVRRPQGGGVRVARCQSGHAHRPPTRDCSSRRTRVEKETGTRVHSKAASRRNIHISSACNCTPVGASARRKRRGCKVAAVGLVEDRSRPCWARVGAEVA